MKRYLAASLVALVSLVLLSTTLMFLLGAVFLAFGEVFPLWLAALATAMSSTILAIGLVVLFARSKPRRHHAPAHNGEIASRLVRRYPLGAAGTALTAGVLVSCSESTRSMLIKSVDSYVRTMHESPP